MAGRLALVKRLAQASDRFRLIGMATIDKEREERLAAALRENLRRRKAQAREHGPSTPDPAPKD